MSNLPNKRDCLLAELQAKPDPHARLEILIQKARARPPLADTLRTPAHEVEGCLARLWLVPEYSNGRCWFRCDSDSLIVKAVAGLLCEFYSGATPADILALDPTFLRQTGITAHLTANRRNALSRVWEKIRDFAQKHEPGSAGVVE